MRSHNKLIRSLLAFAVVLVAAVTVVVIARARNFGERVAATPSNVAPASVAAAQGPIDMAPKQFIRVFVHEFDLYPDQVRIKPGRIIFGAENDKQTDIVLVLERISPGQAPQRAAAVNVARNIKREAKDVTLDAGEYVFYEESNPKLRGQIIVDPN